MNTTGFSTLASPKPLSLHTQNLTQELIWGGFNTYLVSRFNFEDDLKLLLVHMKKNLSYFQCTISYIEVIQILYRKSNSETYVNI